MRRCGKIKYAQSIVINYDLYERKCMGTATFDYFNGPLLISSNYLLIGSDRIASIFEQKNGEDEENSYDLVRERLKWS